MSKWKLRGCPRCSGDLYLEKEYDEYSQRCLQCGYTKSIAGSLVKDAYYQTEQQPETVKIPVGGTA